MIYDEDEDEVVKPKIVEVVRTQSTSSSTLPMSPGFQLDPISAFLLLPVLPLIYLFNLQAQMMNQITQGNNNRSSGGKVTTISREGNNLTIIEKYL